MIDVRCPDCDYSPLDASAVDPENNTPPTDQIDVLDAFDVMGADDGHVFCPECGMEFPVPLPEPDQTQGTLF